ncbi:MAG: alpha/beta hydrolase [Alphaproteobacteria bacterium]|nr:alpha/beta hydrolase [Alphaproteobacteria bacterium]
MAVTSSQLGPLRARHVRPDADARDGVVALLHGAGLGPWIWERDQALLAARGFESLALELPGHGERAGEDVGYDEVEQACAEALSTLEAPALVGHSLGGLVAQRVAAEVGARAMVLVSAHPPAEVPYRPTRAGVRQMLSRLPALALGRPLRFGIEAYLPAGLQLLPEGERQAVFERVGPWPGRMVRDLAVRPSAPAAPCPTLVTHGFQDGVASLWTARLLADYHDSILWRFDDLGHFPMLEPGGERHLEAVAGWLERPRGRRVVEIDPMGPEEGVGQSERDARRPRGVRSNSRFRRR